MPNSSRAEITAAGEHATVSIPNSGTLGNQRVEQPARLPAVSAESLVANGTSEASEGSSTDPEETPATSPSGTPPSSYQDFQSPPASPSIGSVTPRYVVSDSEGGQEH